MSMNDTWDKLLKRGLLIVGILFSAVGVLGVVDGVISTMSGGYADNIVFGALILLFGLPCLIAYLCIRAEESR